MDQFDAVVAGHICLDIIPQMPSVNLQAVLTPGALIEIGAALLSTGGPVSNTGRNLRRLGIKTRLMGKVGDDPFGEIILRLIRTDHPSLVQDMIVTKGETSSYTVVMSSPLTDRLFLHCTGANHTFGAGDVNYERLKQAKLFHFGYPPLMKRMYTYDGIELESLFHQAKDTGVITSLDMALPDPDGPSGRVDWRRVLARTLPYVDIFVPSLDEILFMLRRDVPPPAVHPDTLIAEIAAELLDMGAKVVGIKLGSRGLYVRTGADGAPHTQETGWRRRELWAPCFVPEPLVGTTGSGDATIAGFLAGVLHGQGLEQALTSAVAVGACNVEAADALSGVLTWRATQARVQAGWPRAPVIIDAPGWEWDSGHHLWIGPHNE